MLPFFYSFSSLYHLDGFIFLVQFDVLSRSTLLTLVIFLCKPIVQKPIAFSSYGDVVLRDSPKIAGRKPNQT